jgi:hypothetical protein
MKALVQEKMRDWTAKLGTLGINCLEMTGDSEFYNKKAIHDSDLILTTPEVCVTSCFASDDLNKPPFCRLSPCFV